MKESIVFSDSTIVEFTRGNPATLPKGRVTMGLNTEHTVSIHLGRVEGWEVEEILMFHRKDWDGEGLVSINGHILTFDTGADLYPLGWDEKKICQEGEAECLVDVLYNLLVKDALSLTFLSEWHSSGSDDGEDISLDTFERIAEHMPTLALQEVLARRLSEGVRIGAG